MTLHPKWIKMLQIFRDESYENSARAHRCILALVYTALELKTCTIMRFISLVYCVLTSTSFLFNFLANTGHQRYEVLMSCSCSTVLSYPRLENASVAPDRQCFANVFDPTKGFVPHYREEFIINCVTVSLCIASLEAFWNLVQTNFTASWLFLLRRWCFPFLERLYLQYWW